VIILPLIHKSNKLIEGKLDDVKDNLTNSFEVGILSDNVEGLCMILLQNFQ
jgi:ABC-2 type transport system ATP-binding protein